MTRKVPALASLAGKTNAPFALSVSRSVPLLLSARVLPAARPVTVPPTENGPGDVVTVELSPPQPASAKRTDVSSNRPKRLNECSGYPQAHLGRRWMPSDGVGLPQTP